MEDNCEHQKLRAECETCKTKPAAVPAAKKENSGAAGEGRVGALAEHVQGQIDELKGGMDKLTKAVFPAAAAAASGEGAGGEGDSVFDAVARALNPLGE